MYLRKVERKRAEVTGNVTITRIILRTLFLFGPSIFGWVLYSTTWPIPVGAVGVW
jgi:hypothetical protein